MVRAQTARGTRIYLNGSVLSRRRRHHRFSFRRLLVDVVMWLAPAFGLVALLMFVLGLLAFVWVGVTLVQALLSLVMG